MVSGIIYGTTSNATITVKVEWSSSSNVSGNYSSVSAKCFAKKNTSATIATEGSGTWTLYLGDKSQVFTKTIKLNPDNTWVSLGSISNINFTHDSEGKRTLDVVLEGKMKASNSTWQETYLAETITLDTILQPTSPTYSSTSLSVGDSLQITLTNTSSDLLHDITCTWNGTSYIVSTNVLSNSTITWVVPPSFNDYFSNTSITSGTATIYVNTKISDAEVAFGSTSQTITINKKISNGPMVSILTFEENNYPSNIKNNVYIVGQSKILISVQAVPDTGTTIDGYTITALGKTYSSSSANIGTITSTNTLIKATVTDSLGGSTTKEYNLVAEPYSSPSISIASCYRINSNGEASESGTSAAITLSASISSLSGYNSIALLRIGYKLSTSTDDNWNYFVSLNSGLGTDVQNQTYIFNNAILDVDSSYIFKVEATDLLGTVSIAEIPLQTKGCIMSWTQGGTGIAFGMVADETAGQDKADFNWEIHARKNILVDEGISFGSENARNKTIENLGLNAGNGNEPLSVEGGGTGANTAEGARENLGISKQDIVDLIYPIGSFYITINAINPMELFGGTWEQIQDTFLLAAGGNYSGGATGGGTSYKIPSHKHLAPIGLSSNKITVFNNFDYITNEETSGAYFQSSASVGSGNLTHSYIPLTGDSGGHSMDIIPPYLAVYMWKRTA